MKKKKSEEKGEHIPTFLVLQDGVYEVPNDWFQKLKDLRKKQKEIY